MVVTNGTDMYSKTTYDNKYDPSSRVRGHIFGGQMLKNNRSDQYRFSPRRRASGVPFVVSLYEAVCHFRLLKR